MHRTALAFAVAASLLATTPSLFDPFWRLVSSLWSQSTTDSGCRMDPDGRCRSETVPAPASGCIMDSDGRCRDSGCGMDPWGCPQGS